MSRHFSAIVLLVLIGCTPVTEWRPAKTQVNARVEAPIELVGHGLVFVPIGERRFAMVDTGASTSFVSNRFVEERKLTKRPEPHLELRDAQWKASRSHWVVRIDHLDVGGATFSDFDAIVDRTGMLGGPIDAVLGREVFREVLLTIDYPRRKLVVENGSLPEPNGRDVFPLKRDNRDNLLIPMSINGREASLILDTGVAGAGTALAQKRAYDLKWAVTPVETGVTRSWFGEAKTYVGRMDGEFQLGQYAIQRPMVSMSQSQDDDFLGADILRNFIVTIDQKNDRVRMTRPAGAPNSIDTPPIRKLGFGVTGMSGTVELSRDSAARKSGLRNGDRLIEIEGIPFKHITYLHVNAIERGKADTVDVRIVRDGKEQMLRVPLTVVVP